MTGGFEAASGAGFASPAQVRSALEDAGYLADDEIAATVFLAGRLGKPVLVEGPAGTGKTELAKALSAATGRLLVRLQCYEGLDESKALYEWNYRRQLLRIQLERGVPEPEGASTAPGDAGDAAVEPDQRSAGRGTDHWRGLEDDLFSEEFLLARPLLQAIRSPEPVVLLIDEVDRVEVETEALLLEVLSDFQVSIPELGTVRARTQPLVVLTSNNTRDLSEALKRRCLFLHLDYPALERERAIVRAKVPGIDEDLAEEVVRVVRSLRRLELDKRPSISETLDWARTLVLLGARHADAETAQATLNVLVKSQQDLELAAKELNALAGA
jgi:MoxR-like ATPase